MTDTTTEPTEDLVDDVELGAEVESFTTCDPDTGEITDNLPNATAGEDDEPDTFPRSVVEDLRKEAATYRTKAKDRDDLAHRLHASLVAATGRLADPSDLAFDEAHITDETALTAALDELLAAKPHLASRRLRGDVGQGAAGGDDVSLAGMLRARA